MLVSNVERQVVVSAPAGVAVSEVVCNYLLSLWTCEEWKANIVTTFAPAADSADETKYTATRSMDRNAEYKQLDSDHILSVNVVKLPSGDLLLIVSEHSEYPHELEVVEHEGCTLAEVIVSNGFIKWSVTSHEGVTLKDHAHCLESAKHLAEINNRYNQWVD